jgi:N-acetylmuramoyl-L-alanine amidase
MVSQTWDREQERLVRELADAAARGHPFVVVIDPGHGGIDGGTQGSGLLEKQVTLDLALRLKQRLEDAGCQAILTRQDDTYLPLEERCEIADRAGAGAFVSLHLNADARSADTAGIETYYASRKKLGSMATLRESLGLKHDIPVQDHRSVRLAAAIHRRLCEATGSADRQVRDSEFVVVTQTACPAVLVECGYLSHPPEAARFADEAYKNTVATAVATGVLHFLQSAQMNPLRDLVFEPPPLLPEAEGAPFTPAPAQAELPVPRALPVATPVVEGEAG